jgi:hypothetical protein
LGNRVGRHDSPETRDAIIPLEAISCSGFPHGFAHLASVSTIAATRLALVRSLISLGPSHPTVVTVRAPALQRTRVVAEQTAAFRKSDLAPERSRWAREAAAGGR